VSVDNATVSVGSSNPSETASVAGSDPPSTDPRGHLSPGIIALIITLPLLLLCLACSIGIWLCMRRRRRLGMGVSTDTIEKPINRGQRSSWRNTPSNLSEFGVDALTIQEQFSAPPTMNPDMAAAILSTNALADTPLRRHQPSGSATEYPPGILRNATSSAGHALDGHPTILPPRGGTPSQIERRRSRNPTAFFTRLSHNVAAAFRSPSPQEPAAVDDGADETSIAESNSTPMTLGMRLNYPAATASSTMHGSDTESENAKDNKLRSSIGSYCALTGESTQAPSFSSRASLGHSPSHGPGLKVRPIHPDFTEGNTDALLFVILSCSEGTHCLLTLLTFPATHQPRSVPRRANRMTRVTRRANRVTRVTS
jgi:hypothetical protein